MNVAIYDADKRALKKLRAQLKHYGRKHKTWKDRFVFFDHADSLLNCQREHSFDVILMEALPDGFLMAERLRSAYRGLLIAFVTTTREYALDAFRLRCFHYMLKPLTDEKVAELLDYARRLYLCS